MLIANPAGDCLVCTRASVPGEVRHVQAPGVKAARHDLNQTDLNHQLP